MAIVEIIHKSVSLIAPGQIVVEVDVEFENRVGHILRDYGYLYLAGEDLIEMYQAMDDNGKKKFLEIFNTLQGDWERLHQLEMFHG